MATLEELKSLLGEDQPYRRLPTADGSPLLPRKKREERLVHAFRGLLCSNIASKGMRDPDKLTIDDLLINLHMFDRLFIAMGTVKDFREYRADPSWMADAFTLSELQGALAEAQRRLDEHG